MDPASQGTQTRGVRGRLGGYLYECNVAALRTIDVLRRRASAIVLERRHADQDHFDDLKVLARDELHAYQVRWGMHAQADLTWRLFAGKVVSDFALPNLIEVHRTLVTANPGQRVILHVYTTRRLQSGDPLEALLQGTDDPALLRFSNGPESNVLVFDVDATLNLMPGVDSIALTEILRNLVVEVQQLQCPASLEQEVAHGHPMREAIVTALEEIGLSDPPSCLDLHLAYTQLVHLGFTRAVYGRAITLDVIESLLGIGLDRGVVPQDFPFDESRAVASPLHQVLADELATNIQARIVAVKGPPGSGKSWALTTLARDWNAGDGAPIHYCFERPQGDTYLRQRAMEESVVANLISAIRMRHPSLSCFATPNYATTRPQLEKVLACLAGEVRIPAGSIPIIIDGLDHAVRTLGPRAEQSTEASVLHLLHELRVPPGITVVVGTQPVPFLDHLIEARGPEVAVIDIPPWGQSEVRHLLGREEALPDAAAAMEELVGSVLERSRGLPLYVHYAAATVKTLGANDEDAIRRALEALPRLPISRDIAEYYDYLWHHAVPAARSLLLRLAVLEFFVSRQEMESTIYPVRDRLGILLAPAWEVVRPLLQVEGEDLALFHDSFRRFLLGRFEELEVQDRQQLAQRIVDFLTPQDFYESDRAFRYLWRYRVMAGQQRAVCDEATVATIDTSISMGRSEEEIREILRIALQGADDVGLTAVACRIGFLLAYLPPRFDNLPPAEFVRAAGALGRDHVVQRFLERQSYVGQDHDSFLNLLEHAAREKWVIDGRRLLDKWRQTLRRYRDQQPSVDVRAFVRALALWGGGRTAIGWVRQQKKKPSQEALIGEVCLACAEAGRVEDLAVERRLARSNQRRAALDCLIAAVEGRASDLSRAQFDDALPLFARWNPLVLADWLVERGVSPEFVSALVPFEQALFTVPDAVRLGTEAQPYAALRVSLRLAMGRYQPRAIADARAWLTSLPLSYIKAYAELGVVTGIAQGTLDRGGQPDLAEVAQSLERLLRWTDPPHAHPRAWDLQGLNGVITKLCGQAARLVLVAGTDDDRQRLFAFLRELLLSSQHELGMDAGAAFPLVFEVTEYALSQVCDPLSRTLIHSLCRDIHDHVVSTIGYETERARRLLDVSRLWAASDSLQEADDAFETAIQASYAHGWHKDRMLFHVGELADALNRVDPSRQQDRLRLFGELIRWIDWVTDGDETRHLESYFFQYVSAWSIDDAVYLLRLFEARNVFIQQRALIRFAAEGKVAPALRCALLLTMSDGFSDEMRALPRALMSAWRDAVVSDGSLARSLGEATRNYIECGMPDGPDRDATLAAWDILMQQDATTLAAIDLAELLPETEQGTRSPDPDEPSPDEFAQRLQEATTETLLQMDAPYSFQRSWTDEVLNRADRVTPEEILTWAQGMRRWTTLASLLRKRAAESMQAADPGRSIQILVEAFADLWGWQPEYSSSSWDLALAAIGIDPQKAVAALRGDFVASAGADRGAGHGGFSVLGRTLLEVGAVDMAQEVFDEVVSLCQTMFRSFPPPAPAYDWLGNVRAHARPPLPGVAEHEVLARRLLVPELDMQRLAAVAVRTALEWLPSFATSLIAALPQLTTVRARTSALVALRAVDLSDEQRIELRRGLDGEKRLPVLLETQRLGLALPFPPLTPFVTVPTKHPLEDTLWRAVMPLVQEEFEDVAVVMEKDPDDLRRLFVHRIATTRWDAGLAADRQHRYVHPNYSQIPFESLELQLLMDELYQAAAASFPALPSGARRQLAVLVTHNDPELLTPSFSCPPLTAVQLPPAVDAVQPVLIGRDDWIPLAAFRREQEVGKSFFDPVESRTTWLAAGSARGFGDDASVFEVVAFASLPRITLEDFRTLPARAFRASASAASLISALRSTSLVSGELVLLTLNPDARRDLGLHWEADGLDLKRDDETVVRFCRWFKGFEAKQFHRRWQDRGTMLLARPAVMPDLEAWLGQPLAMYASINPTTVSRGEIGQDEEETAWRSSQHEILLT